MKIITGLIALRGALCLVLFSIAAYGVYVNIPEGYTYISFLLDLNQVYGVGAHRWMMTDFGSGIPLLVFGALFLANRKIKPIAVAICAPPCHSTWHLLSYNSFALGNAARRLRYNMGKPCSKPNISIRKPYLLRNTVHMRACSRTRPSI